MKLKKYFYTEIETDNNLIKKCIEKYSFKKLQNKEILNKKILIKRP